MNNKNRGMLLEKIINQTIAFYEKNDLALFHKKNLDIIFHSTEKNNKLKEAFISKRSTVDYYGIYKGSFIAFEAKSTNENSFPLSNIKEHQMEYLQKIKKHGGHAFLIILMKKYDSIFLLNIDKLNLIEDGKSLNLDFLSNHGHLLELEYPGIIDFLPIIDNL